MLIGTYRTDELNERHPFLTLLAELGRSGQVDRFELAPFTRSEVHDQLAGILGHPPDRPLVTRLHDRGGGNAFFTEELLAVAARGKEGIGLTLRETLLARIGGLSTASRDLLRVVAVAGQSARHDVLATVTRMEQPDIAAALREAIDRQLLLADDNEIMQFRHNLLREAVHDELLPGERLALHAAVAAAVDALPSDVDTDAAVASELAHHWYEARDARHASAGTAARRARSGADVRLRERVRPLPPGVEPLAARDAVRRRNDAPGPEDAHRRGGRSDRCIRSGDRAGACGARRGLGAWTGRHPHRRPARASRPLSPRVGQSGRSAARRASCA